MTGEDKPAEAKRSPEAILSAAKSIVESITEGNWRKQKAALLALLA
jgi:hypothetical protein